MTERLWKEHLAESLIDEADYMNQDEDDRKDAFGSSLSFGTAGIRGKIGLGPNRLNRFTVEKVAQGLSDYLDETGEKKVVIGHDIRHLSREFSLAMRGVFNAADIEVIITEDYTTTPELSFFTREYGAAIGIMITASHNPPEYNGIKVYGSDGAQLTDGPAKLMTGYIGKVRDIFNLHSMDFEDAESRGLVRYVSRDTEDRYRQAVAGLTGDIEASALSVVFTSLHGASVPVVPDILSSLHFDNLHLVEAQTVPHPDFPDAESVNPEDRAAFDGAKVVAEETGADVLIATDPDADRVGIVVRHGGEYVHLNGNQLGAVLLYERLKNVTDETIPVIFKTVVTSDIAKKIGRHFGAEVHEVLTGFKYIGEEIRKLEDDPKRRFIMGYEESYGYLLDGFVRDKDAVQLVPYIVKFASRLKNEGRTIVDRLEEIHETFGRQEEIMFSHKFEGLSGKEQMDEIMHLFRNNPPSIVEKRNVIYVEDFMTGERRFESGETEDIGLPKANVVKLHFDDGWIALRPSGTEPKIKLYVSLQSEHIYEEAKIINDMVFGV